MMKGFKIVPKMTSMNSCDFYIVASNGDYKLIGQVMYPNDGQMNDNIECAQTISVALKNRVRKSV